MVSHPSRRALAFGAAVSLGIACIAPSQAAFAVEKAPAIPLVRPAVLSAAVTLPGAAAEEAVADLEQVRALAAQRAAEQAAEQRDKRLDYDPALIAAIGNHDEGTAAPVTPLSAALILADKSDVRRSRVRSGEHDFDIHDRVNYAVEESSLTVQKEEGLITLALRIDTSITAVMDYFEIFLSRMTLCRAAASFLGLDFELVINETRML